MKLYPPSRAASTLTLGMVMLVATTIFASQLSAPNTAEQTTTKLVAEMISKYHISQKPIDDRVSQQLLKRFLKELDPQKLYFTQADVTEFERYKTNLDDLVKAGNVDFAHQAFDRYLKRLDERVALAHKLVDMDHDFTVDESLIIDGEELSWPKDPQEAQERWRKRIKFDILSLKLENKSKTDSVVDGKRAVPRKDDDSEPKAPLTMEEIRTRLHKRYDTVRKTAHATEDGEVLEMYLSSLAHCFDPHSSYMSPQTLEDFQIQMRLSLEGIGAALKSEDGYTVVAQIVPGGAAEKDGRLKVNDKIIAVGQEEGDWVDIIEMKLSRVVRLIRGPGGTKVKLKVITEAGDTKEYVLTRQTIELTSSEVKGEILEAGSRIPGATGRIGVINIPSFYRDFGGAQDGVENFKSTARDVQKVLAEFKKQGGVDGIIIDLRMNGGGALSEAIEVTGLFIDKGPVVQVKEQNGRVRTHDDVEAGVAYAGPLLVICNRLSASASEIFAAAIKDYKRGIVVGDSTTHGKGTVQNVMPVSNRLFEILNPQNRGALKLTIQQFYRVNGDSTQNRGVQSDIVLPSLIDHMDLGESSMDNALEFDRVDPAPHQNARDLVSADLISALRESSQRRVASEADFQKTQRDIERYLAKKNRKSITLNEESLRKERDDEKAERELEKQEDKAENGMGPIFEANAYNNELLHIAADYVARVKGATTAQK